MTGSGIFIAEEVYGVGDMEAESATVVNIEQPWRPFWRTSDIRLFSSTAKVSGFL
jgi:hypothetical protein